MAATDKINGSGGYVLWGAAVNITGASGGAGTVTVTAAGHGLHAKDRVKIAGCVGMTDLNGIWTVASAATTFTITLQTSQTWSAGGTVQEYMDITKWSAEISCGIQDVTDSASAGYREKQSNGFTDAKGTIEGWVIQGANSPTKGTAMTITLLAKSTVYWSGTGIISTEGVSVTVGGDAAVSRSLGFEASGQLAESNS